MSRRAAPRAISFFSYLDNNETPPGLVNPQNNSKIWTSTIELGTGQESLYLLFLNTENHISINYDVARFLNCVRCVKD